MNRRTRWSAVSDDRPLRGFAGHFVRFGEEAKPRNGRSSDTAVHRVRRFIGYGGSSGKAVHRVRRPIENGGPAGTAVHRVRRSIAYGGPSGTAVHQQWGRVTSGTAATVAPVVNAVTAHRPEGGSCAAPSSRDWGASPPRRHRWPRARWGSAWGRPRRPLWIRRRSRSRWESLSAASSGVPSWALS